MPTPATRTPVRIARGSLSNLTSSLSDLGEGEICWATDSNKLYVVETESGTKALRVHQAETPDKIEEGNTNIEVVDTGSDGHFKVLTEGSERLRVIADGKLGVGIAAPTSTLHVAGTARATQQTVADVSAISDSATITLDFATSTNFNITTHATTARTLANPSNAVAGASGTILVTGAGFSGYGTNLIWNGGTAPTWTAATNKVDVVSFFCYSATKIFLSYVLNYDIS